MQPARFKDQRYGLGKRKEYFLPSRSFIGKHEKFLLYRGIANNLEARKLPDQAINQVISDLNYIIKSMWCNKTDKQIQYILENHPNFEEVYCKYASPISYNPSTGSSFLFEPTGDVRKKYTRNVKFLKKGYWITLTILSKKTYSLKVLKEFQKVFKKLLKEAGVYFCSRMETATFYDIEDKNKHGVPKIKIKPHYHATVDPDELEDIIKCFKRANSKVIKSKLPTGEGKKWFWIDEEGVKEVDASGNRYATAKRPIVFSKDKDNFWIDGKKLMHKMPTGESKELPWKHLADRFYLSRTMRLLHVPKKIIIIGNELPHYTFLNTHPKVFYTGFINGGLSDHLHGMRPRKTSQHQLRTF